MRPFSPNFWVFLTHVHPHDRPFLRVVLVGLTLVLWGLGWWSLRRGQLWSLVLMMALATVSVPLLADLERSQAEKRLHGCKSNFMPLGTALEMYATDNAGRYPSDLAHLTPNYLKAVPTCPAAQRDTYSAGYASASNPDRYTVVCRGNHHQEAGIEPQFPQYSHDQGFVERP